jgi:hypothetical protein
MMNQEGIEYMINMPLINVLNSNYQQLKKMQVFLLEKITVPVLRPQRPQNPRQKTKLFIGAPLTSDKDASVSAYNITSNMDYSSLNLGARSSMSGCDGVNGYH